MLGAGVSHYGLEVLCLENWMVTPGLTRHAKMVSGGRTARSGLMRGR
jgi:hypothetical protein